MPDSTFFLLRKWTVLEMNTSTTVWWGSQHMDHGSQRLFRHRASPRESPHFLLRLSTCTLLWTTHLHALSTSGAGEQSWSPRWFSPRKGKQDSAPRGQTSQPLGTTTPPTRKEDTGFHSNLSSWYLKSFPKSSYQELQWIKVLKELSVLHICRKTPYKPWASRALGFYGIQFVNYKARWFW